ncbi:unnamed protein product [Urochloa decumbens]|uniref:Disease resistance N-terminal domain-containing protein n=1 Tax=Urochloa decumbens TaxID=240449 RepID=A0ABC9FL25_9POAL
MEIFLSAVLGELASRSIQFFINKSSTPKAMDVKDSLQRALLRAQVIIDEATGRHIRNQAMLQQVDMLRDAMHHGCYILDTFRYQSHDDKAKYQDTQPHGSEELEVLPIVGPAKVGKSTLVAHVCKNERVRDHFSKILFLRDHDFTDNGLTILREGCAMKHQNCISNMNNKKLMPRTSKIIIANRSANITEFGTTQALNLKYLSFEASWYFFKTIAFGSMDPEMHTTFGHVAMGIAKLFGKRFIGMNIIARVLRDNFDIRFWCKVLDFSRRLVQKYVSKFGVHPFDVINQNRPVHLGRMAIPFEDLVFYCVYQRYSREEVPKIRVEDVIYGNVKALGKSEFLSWVSPIPPYYSYVVTCEVRELKHRAAKRKRSTANGITLC